MSRHEEVLRPIWERPSLVVRLLNALKGFYTFKDLEAKMGIPYQLLWRYTSLRTIPERQTAKRILDSIEERGLVDDVISKSVVRGSNGFIEYWRYLYDQRFLNIVGYRAYRFLMGTRVTALMVYPQEDSALGVVASEWLGTHLSVATSRLNIGVNGHSATTYKSRDRAEIVQVYLPKGALRENDRVVVIKNIAKNLDSLGALVELAEINGARVVGLIAVASVSSEWRDRCRDTGIDRVMVLRDYSSPAGR